MGRKQSRGAEAVWRERLARFASGKETVAEFCLREGVSSPSFYQWRKRLGRGRRRAKGDACKKGGKAGGEAASRFVPVSVSGFSTVAIELPGGITVRVPVAGAEALRTAILALGDAFGEVRSW